MYVYYACVCVCVCFQGISPSITGRILMKLRMDIPITIAITFEPEVVETSGWFQNVPCQNIYQKCRSPHDA